MRRKHSREFWPGPLTLVVPRAQTIAPEVSAGLDTIGVRAPHHPLAQALLRAFDGPIAAPSANRSTHISPTTAEHVRTELGRAVDLILDGGPCEVGIESTVVDVSGARAKVLRPGAITREQIAAFLGEADNAVGRNDASQPAISPGQQSLHYAPQTPAFRFSGRRRNKSRRGVVRGSTRLWQSCCCRVQRLPAQSGKLRGRRTELSLCRAIPSPMRGSCMRRCTIWTTDRSGRSGLSCPRICRPGQPCAIDSCVVPRVSDPCRVRGKNALRFTTDCPALPRFQQTNEEPRRRKSRRQKRSGGANCGAKIGETPERMTGLLYCLQCISFASVFAASRRSLPAVAGGSSSFVAYCLPGKFAQCAKISTGCGTDDTDETILLPSVPSVLSVVKAFQSFADADKQIGSRGTGTNYSARWSARCSAIVRPGRD